MEEHGFYNAAQDIYEFHVDVHKDFQELCKSLEFGGNLSIRKDPRSKVIISLGHDECIFNMFTYTKKCWSSCENAQPIMPKDNGTGVMYSCIQSREFGFGFRDLTDGEIDLLNSCRRTYFAHISSFTDERGLNNQMTKIISEKYYKE